MSRVTRMGIGLVSLILVLALAGWLFGQVGIEGEAAAWSVLGVGVVWIGLMIWWALRAPERLSSEERSQYLAFLRHAEYKPDPDDT